MPPILATCERCGTKYGHPGPCPVCGPLFGPHILKALELAVDVHKNEWRFGGLPYLVHIFDLVKTLGRIGIPTSYFSTYQLALLHDTVESGCDPARIAAISTQLALHVEDLTYRHVSDQKLDRQLKADYIASLATKDVECLVVKCVDRINNVWDFLDHGGDYAFKYFHKADALFDAFYDRRAEITERFGPEVWSNLEAELIKLHEAIDWAASDRL